MRSPTFEEYDNCPGMQAEQTEREILYGELEHLRNKRSWCLQRITQGIDEFAMLDVIDRQIEKIAQEIEATT